MVSEKKSYKEIFSYFIGKIKAYILGKHYFGKPLSFIGSRVTIFVSKENTNLGKHISIQDNVFIQSNGTISLGDSTIIKRDAYLIINTGSLIAGKNCGIGKRSEISVNGGKIKLGDNVRLASNVFITNANHKIEDIHTPIMEQGILTNDVIIEDDVWIGHGAIILPGVVIGRSSVIGAGSVVTKNVPDYSIVAGNPAKVIRKR